MIECTKEKGSVLEANMRFVKNQIFKTQNFANQKGINLFMSTVKQPKGIGIVIFVNIELINIDLNVKKFKSFSKKSN